jgi:hypothetical protein
MEGFEPEFAERNLNLTPQYRIQPEGTNVKYKPMITIIATCFLSLPNNVYALPSEPHILVTGKVMQRMQDEFVIESGKMYYHVRSDGLSAEQRNKLEMAQTRQISMEIPVGAIDDISPKNAAPEAAPAARGVAQTAEKDVSAE